MVEAKKKPAKKRLSITQITIAFKDPDMPEGLRKFGEFGEYFEAVASVNTNTGAGTIKFARKGRVNG